MIRRTMEFEDENELIAAEQRPPHDSIAAGPPSQYGEGREVPAPGQHAARAQPMHVAAPDRPGPTRRSLLRAAGVAALSAASYRRVLGANERVGLGFIGFGLIGKRHVLDFKDQPDADLVAVAEVHRGRLDEAAATMGGSPTRYGDFRRLLDDKRRRRRRRLDARPLARPDDDDGLRGGEGRVRREAAEPVRPRGAVDGRRGPAAQAGRPGRDAAAVRAALSEGARADPRRPHRQGRRGPDVVLSEHHAGLRLASRRRPAAGARLRPLARPRAEAALQPEPVALPLPLVLGLLGRPDDEPRPALARHRPLVPGRQRPVGRSPARAGGSPSRTTARRPTRRMRCSNTTAGRPRGRIARRAGARRRRSGLEFCGTQGQPDDLAQGLRRDPRPGGRPATRPSAASAARTRSAGRPGRARSTKGGDEDRGRSRTHRATSTTSSAATPGDFLECVRSRREPISDLESGHRVATACHLANLSLRLGRKLRWDAERETIVGRSRGRRHARAAVPRPLGRRAKGPAGRMTHGTDPSRDARRLRGSGRRPSRPPASATTALRTRWAWSSTRSRSDPPATAGGAPEDRFADPIRFLDHARSLGARGIQVGIGARDDAYADALRARAEAASMYLEGIVSLPRDEADLARFEAEIRTAKRAGATIVRTVMLSGRRYETFDSLAAFRQFADRAFASLALARADRRAARRPARRREPQGLARRRADRDAQAARLRPRRGLPRHGQQHGAAGRPDGGRRGPRPAGVHDPLQGHGRRGIREGLPARRGPARRGGARPASGRPDPPRGPARRSASTSR